MSLQVSIEELALKGQVQTLRVAVRFLMAIVQESGGQDTLIRSALDQGNHALEKSGGLRP